MNGACCPQPKPSSAPERTEEEPCCEIHPPTTCGPAQCPACGALGKPVKRITLGALLKPEARAHIPRQEEFCFCRTAGCEVVYFRASKVLFRKEDLAVPVGLKEPNAPTAPVCYCFGWTPQKICAEIEAAGKSTVVDQIKARVKAGNCYCEVTNPQGSCCLGNVTAEVQKALGKL
ncbi:MAG: (2Fe-2S)-binding protein [Candidatus Omnitrophica bacterium]|nr:(2Fe-2S)-binding protein [Candidatus Omnitrophota bacterium]